MAEGEESGREVFRGRYVCVCVRADAMEPVPVDPRLREPFLRDLQAFPPEGGADLQQSTTSAVKASSGSASTNGPTRAF